MTTYLAWKDPCCNGVNPQWETLSHKQFIELVNSSSFKNRRFIRLHGVDGGGRIVIEASESQYKDWLVEKEHKKYLRSVDPDYKVDSYHGLEVNGECLNGEELLPDTENLVEDTVLKELEIETLRAALVQLNRKELELITYLYLSKEHGTECGYSAMTGIPQKTINNRKREILSKLKTNFE